MKGHEPLPEVAWVARICEEFHCLPTEAIREIRRAPDGLIAQVIDAKHFMATFAMYEAAEHKDHLPKTPMLELLQEIEFEEIRRIRTERTAVTE